MAKPGAEPAVGKARRRPRDRLRALPFGRIALGVTTVIIMAALARIALFDDPSGGRPFAISTIEIKSPDGVSNDTDPLAEKPAGEPKAAHAAETPGEKPPAAAAGHTASDESPAVDTAHAEEHGTAESPKHAEAEQPFADLVEETRFGPIPRVGANGGTPFRAFRRPAPVPPPEGAQVALLVRGLGMDLDRALDVVSALPPDVSLAFKSYAPTLDQSAGAARAAGHETFLEVPFEPFDYPDNDPGPDTLLMGQPPRDNLDRLYHVMSRMEGYVGVHNDLGARFTGSAPDFSPVIEELNARGLSYIDDGSSSRSIAEQLASARRMPFIAADLLIDAAPSRDTIIAALDTLEQKAKSKGQALGMLSGLPISVNIIAEWIASLPAKGITLVPVSALMKDQNAQP